MKWASMSVQDQTANKVVRNCHAAIPNFISNIAWNHFGPKIWTPTAFYLKRQIEVQLKQTGRPHGR
jgi:hypothetical protein